MPGTAAQGGCVPAGSLIAVRALGGNHLLPHVPLACYLRPRCPLTQQQPRECVLPSLPCPQVAGPQLSDASRRALYPELHKRLDDAHNSVRCAACRALCAFVRSAGSSYCDTNSGYLVAGVVIHMDDSDPAVQVG